MTFLEFLQQRLEKGGFTTEDTLASLLPLFRQVAAAHERGLVAPLRGVDQLTVNGVVVGFDDAARTRASRADGTIDAMNRPQTEAFSVMATSQRSYDVDAGAGAMEDLDIADPTKPLTEPRYVTGYRSWEHLVGDGHHDPPADQMVLGMILASVACGFDLTRRDELEVFVTHRRNLFAVAPKLNPVIAQVIVRMTELDRHRRARDVGEIVRLLETYRDQPVDFDIDLSRVDALNRSEGAQRRGVLLERLRERLFEISRRNRLLYFKASQKNLNLTIASVPALFDVRGIQPEQLMTWNHQVEQAFSSGKTIALGQYLRFEDAPYIAGVLDTVIAEVKRDEAEFGFSQLRLVICFLRWHNLKEAADERIDSPLLLLNVKLARKKGVRDSYHLQPVGREAEVNPVLRYHLRSVYGIELPETIELTAAAVDAFHAQLVSQVRKSEPGVSIEKISKPHIEIIHDRARRRLDQYKRRQRPTRRRSAHALHDLAYSYRGQVDPLGLKLFQKMISPTPAPMRELVDTQPKLRNFMVAPADVDGASDERERTFVSFHESTSNNPYAWDFDLCNLTLANFKYRKMSLVRDYETRLTGERSSKPFDSIFSLAPRQEVTAGEDVPLEEQHTIVECDPTQAAAVGFARRGQSYIIQGPPGTGKSQTITNLIADYVARGKRVLFVCEKRAALDVVYHRLRQKRLESLCCLIHDSQDDKKEFIADLRATYEGLLQNHGVEGVRAEQRRRELADAIRIDLSAVRSFDDRMRDPEAATIPLRSLLARGVALQRFTPALSLLEMERVPPYRDWLAHDRTLKRVAALLQNLSSGPVFGQHPLRRLSPSLATQARPHEAVQNVVERTGRLLAELLRALGSISLPTDEWDTLSNVLMLARYAERVEPLLRNGTYAVVDTRQALAHMLDGVRAERQELEERLDAARAANVHWREPLNPDDTELALDLARSLEASIFAVFRADYWRMRKMLQLRYDFAAHPVKPRWTQVLQRLQDEHQLVAEVARLEKRAATQFHCADTLAEYFLHVDTLRATVSAAPPVLLALHRHCVESADARQTVAKLVEALRQLESVEHELGDFLVGADTRRLQDLSAEIASIGRSMHLLNEVLPLLGELSQLPPAIVAAIRHFELSMPQLEGASTRRTIEEAFARDASLSKTTLASRERHLERLWKSYRELQRENVRGIVEAVRAQFVAHVATSVAPAAQLSRADAAFKKRYSTGRRELEHEFGKSMRYRSIRDLFSGPAGDVMLDLKPVWLMSPLSVSDTLPLDTDHFDVVIFDEASQIALEEAIPSIFRSEQIIVVGDQMQLPPTNFFSSKQDGNDDALVADDDGEMVALSLDSDSFLNHAARNLQSTMLGWHYRSRSESLISFSNAAFYQGRLLTVPDRAGRRAAQQPIAVQQAESGYENVELLLDRALSFHHMTAGVYESRRNATEAFYIAHLVRGLLMRGGGETIGIIAFSEAQQSEIEHALGIVATEDPEFARRLEAEYAREEDDQFVGLLVKNLENIQGDERDIIILSVCYGRNRDGRILMNFGPINQSGGEKRLNVAFSRAKKQMALVSSMRHVDVTNTYNDGANALRRYLKYAEAMSVSDEVTARAVLREAGLPESQSAAEIDRDPVVRDVAERLRGEGYEVALGVGQSHFRCDVAVRKAGEDSYRAAILIDTESYYRQEHLFERDLLRPAILESFGWRVLRVLTKEWYDKPEATFESLLAEIAREPEVIVAPERHEAATGVAADVAADEHGSAEIVVEEQPQDAAVAPPVDGSRVEVSPLEAPALHSDASGDVLQAANATELAPEPSVTLLPQPEVTRVPMAAARRFEHLGDGSSKFWEIRVDGAAQDVRFGRIGTTGQRKTKTFSDEEAARSEAEKLIREKLKKGYVEVPERRD